MFATRTSSQKKNWNRKIKNLTNAVWIVGSNEKERTDLKLENAHMMQEIADILKQEIADMKLEKAGMKLKIDTLTLGLQCFARSDDDI